MLVALLRSVNIVVLLILILLKHTNWSCIMWVFELAPDRIVSRQVSVHTCPATVVNMYCC
jgi:hypothetical protein